MAGIGHHLHLDGPVLGVVLPGGSEVVLHVARVGERLGIEFAFELPEHPLVALADHVHEDVEPAAVRHAEHASSIPVDHRRTEHGVEHGDEALGAFQPEALLADELGVEELLEALGLFELAEDAELLGPSRPGVASSRDPGSTSSDRSPACACTRCPRCGSRRCGGSRGSAQIHHLFPADPPGGELAVEVPDRQPVVQRVELLVHRGFFWRSGSRSAIRCPRTR
jgi:hypothetical protein